MPEDAARGNDGPPSTGILVGRRDGAVASM
jgi:hypothetical protein